jgi:hypothetical protein
MGAHRGIIHPGYSSVTLKQATVDIPLGALLCFPFLFALFVYIRRKGKMDMDVTETLCPTCQNVQSNGTVVCVKCGAMTEPLSKWKWIKDVSPSTPGSPE